MEINLRNVSRVTIGHSLSETRSIIKVPGDRKRYLVKTVFYNRHEIATVISYVLYYKFAQIKSPN